MTSENPGMILLNGERQDYVLGLRLVDLIRQAVEPSGADAISAELPGGIAAAVNEEVIPRSIWSKQLINPGDRVEILSAVQGG